MKKIFGILLVMLFIATSVSAQKNVVFSDTSETIGESNFKSVITYGSYICWINEDGKLLYNSKGLYAGDENSIVEITDNVAELYENYAIKNDRSLWKYEFGFEQDYKVTVSKVADNVMVYAENSGCHYIIKEDNTLWAWGYNSNGQLGDGTTDDKDVPVKILDDIKKIYSNPYDIGSCTTVYAVKSDNSLWSWGTSFNGELGNGSKGTSLFPVKILDDVKEIIYCGYKIGPIRGYHDTIYAFKQDNSLWGWGDNSYGELGDGTQDTSLVPKKIIDDALKVKSAGTLNYVIKQDGSLWGWGTYKGRNDDNFNIGGVGYKFRLGNGTEKGSLIPVQIASDVEDIFFNPGSINTLSNGSIDLIKKDNSLWKWGNISYYNLEDSDVLSPKKIMDNVKKVDRLYILKLDNTLWHIGNYDNTDFEKSSEYKYAVKIDTDVKDVIYGRYLPSCKREYILKNDNSLWKREANYIYDSDENYLYTEYPPLSKLINNVKSTISFFNVRIHGTCTIYALTNDYNLWQIDDTATKIYDSNPDIELLSYTITATATTGGAISPQSIIRQEGEHADFFVTCFDGYEILNVVDMNNNDLQFIGKEANTGNYIYRLSNITTGNAITANFVKVQVPPIYEDYTPAATPKPNEEYRNEIDDALEKFTTEGISEQNNIELVKKIETIITQNSKINIEPSDGKVVVSEQILKESCKKLNEMIDYSQKALNGNNIDINKDIIAKLLIETGKIQNGLNISFNTDIKKLKEVDFLTVNSENITISFNPEKIANFGGKKNIDISISNKNSEGEYEVHFLKDGQECDEITDMITIGFDLKTSNIDYNCVMKVEGEKYVPFGGRYNSASNKLEAKIYKSGKYVVAENRKSFDDIENIDKEAKKAIEVLAAKGIIAGKNENTFDPNLNLTRAELTSLFAKLLYLKSNDLGNDFADIKENAWYTPFINASFSAGIINGYPDKTFKPEANILNQEIISILAKTLQSEQGYRTPNDVNKYLNFSNADDIGDWLAPYIALTEREKILIKSEKDEIKLEQAITRREAAIMLYRLFKLL